MPSSAEDRNKLPHEHGFRLSKSARYFADQDAIRESSTERRSGNHHRKMPEERGRPRDHLGSSVPYEPNGTGRNHRTVWTIATQPFGLDMCGSCKHVYDAASYRRLKAGSEPQCQTEVAEDEKCGGTRWLAEDGGATCLACETHYTAKQLGKLPPSPNCRVCGESDWLSHFATFPEALVVPCILAGTSERGVCPECGAPWVRVMEKGDLREHPDREGRSVRNVAFDGEGYSDSGGTLGLTRDSRTTGWRPPPAPPGGPLPPP